MCESESGCIHTPSPNEDREAYCGILSGPLSVSKQLTHDKKGLMIPGKSVSYTHIFLLLPPVS